MLDLCLADSMILYFWQVLKSLKSVHKFIIEFHVLQCLYVGGSSKKQRRVRIISNFRKGETFHFYDNQVLLCVISQCASPPPLLAPSKKGLPLPFNFAKKRIYVDTQLKGELTDLFWNCQDVVYSHEYQ